MTRTETAPWWMTATGYQVYPRSFADSNGDGIGDIQGIISRLDHLADLGVGFVWLSPVYRSPMVDNGYDISDYREVAPEFGMLADLDRLIAEARTRGIGIVMDLVVNHTSDRHHWFETARADRQAPEHDYYVWRDAAPDGGPPSDRHAVFGGPAWTWAEAVGKYYLGYFSPAQPDLNWQNPRLRAEIWEMMNWWLDRGIAGFRMDVISLIGKDVDGEVFEEGPDLHRFLQEMHRETLAGRDVVGIGESWSATPGTALLYCGRDRGELDMIFQFNHVTQGWDEVHGKWKPKPFDLPRLKGVLATWQEVMEEDGWNSLFLSNHDLPRQVSIYGDDGEHRIVSAKMLAIVLHMLKGTPFVYQGEEIGMTNARFTRLEQFRDLEIFGLHAEEKAAGVSTEEFIAGANANGRDNARTPMQWSAAPGAGFTAGTPWIDVNPNHDRINVAADRADPEGVFETYRRLIALRRDRAVVAFGAFSLMAAEHPHVFAFTRELGAERLLVVASFADAPVAFDVPEGMRGTGRCLICTAEPRTVLGERIELAPWEAFVIDAT